MLAALLMPAALQRLPARSIPLPGPGNGVALRERASQGTRYDGAEPRGRPAEASRRGRDCRDHQGHRPGPAYRSVVRTFLFQPFNIPSGSLIPTLLVGDYLFVSKYSYGYSKYSFPFSPPLFSGRIWGSEPKRGDIAVFKLPSDNSTDYIKRVIGLPNDKIQMIDGILYINGQAVKKEKLSTAEVPAGRGLSRPVDAIPGNAAQWRDLHDPGIGHLRQSARAQYGSLPGATRQFLHDGRQPRQLTRFHACRARKGLVLFPMRISWGGRNHLLLDARGRRGLARMGMAWTVRWNRLLKPVG